MTNQEIELNNFIQTHIIKFTSEIGYSYIDAGYGFWQDGAGENHSLKSMDYEYLQNCYKFITRGISDIDDESIYRELIRDFSMTMNQFSKYKSVDFSNFKPSDEFLKTILNPVRKILINKRNELLQYL